MRIHTALLFSAFVTGALACSENVPEETRFAVARLEPTEGHEAAGTVRFEALEEGGVRVAASLHSLAPGPHGFHVHENGDCSEAAAAAGPHFNFLGESAETPDRITGNLGELRAGPDGEARIEGTVGAARLDGPRGITGRAVVVHARGNDPDSPPDGAAGERIACGIIEPVADEVAAARF